GSPSLKLSLPRAKSARLVTGWTSSTSARADQLVTTQDRMVAELEALHSLLRSLLEAAQQAAPPVTSRTSDMAPHEIARDDFAASIDALPSGSRAAGCSAGHLPNMARDDMVRAMALAAQDRMTRPLLTFPRSSPERRRRDEEERRQRVMVITEFAAGDPEATMHALADEKGHDVDDYSDPDAYRGCFACFVR